MRREAELRNAIHKEAGAKFDIASPKEVGRMLFKDMGLDVPQCAIKPGRTQASTCDEVCVCQFRRLPVSMPPGT